MDKVKLTIDGLAVEAPAGTTVLEAAHAAGIKIPTLCYLKAVNAIGACRVCVVDTGARALQAACVLPVSEGMVVKTNTPKVRQARKFNLELTLSTHDKKCLSCVRSGSCELQSLCAEYGVGDENRYAGHVEHQAIDELSPSIVRDPNKCVLCRRCVAMCHKVQRVGVIGATGRGYETRIEPPWKLGISDVDCINCGQCITACPVGALTEKSDIDHVFEALSDPKKHVVVQPAPAVRVGIGEEFGMPIGTRATGKLASALHRLGFARVFDTDFGADLTIMEEANELVERIKGGGVLPMITSCSPGWIKFMEHNYTEFIPNISTCKSPHQMLGAIAKSYYAKVAGIEGKDIVTVSVMPCTAKKYESKRPEMEVDGLRDVDYVITTRELARMIRQAGIDFERLPEGEFDDLLGESSGAGDIFGVTGGVMEAALRTAYEWITGEQLESVDFTAVRGIAGIKEATVKVGELEVKVAVVSGTANAAKLLDRIRAGEATYHFIEVMACPGGCVNGGGQPIVSSNIKRTIDVRTERAKGLYAEDEAKTTRKSHENASIKKLYAEFLGKPGGHESHHLLHTHGYVARPKYENDL